MGDNTMRQLLLGIAIVSTLSPLNYMTDALRTECEIPPPPLNGGFTMMEVGRPLLIYSCIEGYEMIGENVRLCQANWEWNVPAPQCRQFCSNITAEDFPDNGEYHCVYPSNDVIVCDTRCHHGYYNTGDKYYYCGPNTNFLWSFRNEDRSAKVPSCHGGSDVTPCRDLTHGDAPQHGGLICGDLFTGPQAPPRTYCSAVCDHGFEFPNHIGTLLCGPTTGYEWLEEGEAKASCIEQFFPGFVLEEDSNYLPSACTELTSEALEATKASFLDRVFAKFPCRRDPAECVTNVRILCGET